MKNILKSIAIISLLFLGFCITAKAEDNEVSFIVTPAHGTNAAEVYDGQNIVVTVVVNTNENIQAASIDWTYDSTKLEFDGENNCYAGDFDSFLCGDPTTTPRELIVSDNRITKTGSVKLITLKFTQKSGFTANSSALITFKTIKIATNESEITVLNTDKNITVNKVATPENIRGDWNNNKKIDSDDVRWILMYFAEVDTAVQQYQGFSEDKKSSLNYDNNDKFNNEDARAILIDLANKID